MECNLKLTLMPEDRSTVWQMKLFDFMRDFVERAQKKKNLASSMRKCLNLHKS